jgi:hypothetical protein
MGPHRIPANMPAQSVSDPVDLITWVQFRAAFKIATLALQEIADLDEVAAAAAAASTAKNALQALQAEVARFDESEPSWSPESSAPSTATLDDLA